MFRIRAERQELMPVRKTEHAAGYDIFCKADTVLMPYRPMLIPTGLYIEDCLDPSYHMIIVPRSSLHKLSLVVEYGVIDADFRDEMCVKMVYMPQTAIGPNNEVVMARPGNIKEGTRIAQLLIEHTFPLINGVTEKVTRTGGFGSTGV